MSEKKYVVYYNGKIHKYYYIDYFWFDINGQYVKPILYSDDFELTKKVTRGLNARLQEQSN